MKTPTVGPQLDTYERGLLLDGADRGTAIRSQETRNQVRRRKLQLENPDYRNFIPVVSTSLGMKVEDGKVAVASGKTFTKYARIGNVDRGSLIDLKA